MSAYVVDREHICYLVKAAMVGDGVTWWHNGQHHQVGVMDYEQALKVGQMLWDENVKSVGHRYEDSAERDLPGPVGENYLLEKADLAPTWLEYEPVQVLVSCRCYEYQSCEHDGWETSEAKAFIDALFYSTTRRLPGYDAAKWGAPERESNAISLTSLM